MTTSAQVLDRLQAAQARVVSPNPHGEDDVEVLLFALPALIAVARAAIILHDNTADYVRINKLGDPWHNQDMREMRAALAALAEAKP